MSKRMFKRRQR